MHHGWDHAELEQADKCTVLQMGTIVHKSRSRSPGSGQDSEHSAAAQWEVTWAS